MLGDLSGPGNPATRPAIEQLCVDSRENFGRLVK
jgi:hypothetical protein